MNPSIIIPSHTAYLIIDTNFRVVQYAPQLPDLLPGCAIRLHDDLREHLQELVGLETVIAQLLTGQCEHFLIEEVQHSEFAKGDQVQYITLRLEPKSDQEIWIFVEDVTETAVLRQALVQRVNETELLLNALKTTASYNKRIMASMQEALLITNSAGFIKTINQAACELFGYDEAFLLNCNIADLFWAQNQAQSYLEVLWNQSDEAIATEVPCRTQAGEQVIIEFSTTKVQSQVEKVSTFVYVGRDITARKDLEREREKALAKEKELSDLKSRFLAMTSHEFKNPLSTILMSVELLEEFGEDWPPEKRDKYLKRIKQCTTNMNTLLEDILLIGRADVQKLVFDPSPTCLMAFCQELIDEFKPLCQAKHQLILESDLAPQANYVIDTKLLRHVLSNLLSNAIKYSPEGGSIQLKVNCQNQQFLFHVTDQGIGIPPEDQPRLFDYFHRSRNVSDIAGTGLGLSIAKRATELQGGSISFTTQVDRGTTFSVSIPVIEPEE
ncbi:MAG: PAS domain-containing sensor histidine kinase [Spirulina sp. SIO3F2]|nr:PAS domain-containing sensor histidine kinase [Spirulina sp. SIO3F2]